jgi:DNA repair exonuclease SbcCD ATPase subunit
MIKMIEFRHAGMVNRYNKAKGQLELLERQLAKSEERLESVRENLEIWRQVQILFGKVSEYAREQLKLRIEETVTAALQAITNDDRIRFEVAMKTYNNQPAAEWLVVSYCDGAEVAVSPEDARGGGIVDVVSIALRLAMMELARPKPGGPLIFDEPGKHVSWEYAPNLAHFLKEYARSTGRQIIMVTHNDDLAEVADITIQVSMSNGVSHATSPIGGQAI